MQTYKYFTEGNNEKSNQREIKVGIKSSAWNPPVI